METARALLVSAVSEKALAGEESRVKQDLDIADQEAIEACDLLNQRFISPPYPLILS